MDAYLARQPIFKKNEKVYGYELLFRDGILGCFPEISGNAATCRVLTDAFLDIGIEEVTAGKKAFINFTEELLISGMPALFPKTILTVEILEDVSPTDQVIAACIDLAAKGYQIALDDFLYREELEPLIAAAHMIKFDFRLSSVDKLTADVTKVSGRGLKLLAEKVETHEEFNAAIEMGFDYFQGFFFSKPNTLKSRTLPPSKLSLMQIIAEVNSDNFSFSKIEKLIERDISISYKLMRYVNSAFFKRLSQISSVRHAIVLMGEQEIRRFTSLVALAGLADDKPQELVRESFVRAVFCELLAKEVGLQDASDLFTLGLFSLIDAILDQPMEQIMTRLPLGRDMKNALINRTGPLAVYLKIAEFHRSADWQAMEKECVKIGVDPTKIGERYLQSILKADRISDIQP